jgi:RHS repeat-associated protein
VQPGGRITLAWSVEGVDAFSRRANRPPENRYRLQLLLPEGISLAPRALREAELPMFEASESGALLPVEDARGRLKLFIDDAANGPFLIRAALFDADTIIAETELTLSDLRAVEVSREGGEVRAFGGRVEVHFPGGSLEHAVWVRIRPIRPDAMPPYTLSGHAFEIVAERSARPSTPHNQPPNPGGRPVDPPSGAPGQAPSRATDEVLLEATLTVSPTLDASATLSAPAATATVTPAPAQETASPTVGVATETATDLPPLPTEAAPPQDRIPVRRFQEPITIEVQYDEDELDGDESSLLLYFYDETLGVWRPLSTTVDVERNILRARTDHFTVFDYGTQQFESAEALGVESFQTALFTGAATYSTSLWVPPGPAGLQPSLSLSYSSQTVDSADSLTQASSVGMGWSLDTGFIARDTHGTIDFAGDDTFSLNLAGTAHALLPGADGYYHTRGETFWRITYDSENNTWTAYDTAGTQYLFEHQANYPEVDACNVTPRTWRWSLTAIRNIHGQELAFTYQTDERAFWQNDECDPEPKEDIPMTLAVYPATIAYPHGRYRIVFDVSRDRHDYRSSWTDEQSRLRYRLGRISEVRAEQDADGDGSFETMLRRYVFGYESDPDRRIFAGVRWPYECGDSSCSYELGALTLTRLEQYGLGGTDSLPPERFTYDNNHLVKAGNGYGGRVEFDYQSWVAPDGPRAIEQTCQDLSFLGWTNGMCDNDSESGRFYIYSGQSLSVNYSMLMGFQPGAAYRLQATAYGCDGCAATLTAGINNGFGTQALPQVSLPDSTTPVTIDGVLVLRPDASQAQLTLQGSDWSLTNLTVTPLMTRYRVVEKRTYDGVNAAPIIFRYTYHGAAANDPEHSLGAEEPEETRYQPQYSEFRGHSQVDEIGPDGRVAVRFYHQDDDLKGRTYRSLVRDAGGVLLAEELWRFESQALPVTDGPTFPRNKEGERYSDLQITWSYLTTHENRAYDDAGDYAATLVQYQYRAEDQGGGQYGNRTRIVASTWEGGAWRPYRASWVRFFPAASGLTYLVSLPGLVERFACPGGVCSFDSGDRIAARWMLYDGASHYTQAQTVGVLTGERSLVDVQAGGPRYSDRLYQHDAWGNKTHTTTFTSYGNETDLASTGAQTSVVSYDSAYHTYPQRQTDAMQHSWDWEYHTGLGAPIWERDPNGAESSALYDAFGRLSALRRPGDGSGPPSLAVVYHDSARPYWVEVRQRINANQVRGLRQIYDGLGQRIQEQTAGAGLAQGARDVAIDYAYDGYGRPVRQSVAYPLGLWDGSGNPYRADPGQPATRLAYDALGRRLSTVSPDGSSQTNTYSGLELVANDTLGHSTRMLRDVWGRTILVEPPAGPAMTYAYDEADRMVRMQSGGAISIVQFDFAGRKVAMQDADMGSWMYRYDALGNLLRQVDARGCSTVFAYDDLNRMLSKSFDGPGACAETPNVVISYDSQLDGNNGVGRRTGMQDGTGSTAWFYDSRGRLAKQTQVIGGAGIYRTAWGYNSADQVIDTVYPGGANGESGERVESGYAPQGLLQSLQSSQATYIQNASFDAAGRIVGQRLGADVLELQRGYFPWSESAGMGRLQSLSVQALGSGTELQDYRYEYDLAGNILRIEDWVHGQPQAQLFAYDVLSRLSAARTEAGTIGFYDETYSYGGTTGNLIESAGTQYSYQDAAHPHAVTHLDSQQRFEYDANGNQIRRTQTSHNDVLVYDAENRLVQVTRDGALFAEYRYNGVGQMVSRVEGGETTVLVGELVEIDMGSEPVVIGGDPQPTPTSAAPAASPTPTAVQSLTPTPTRTLTPAPTATTSATLTPAPTATPSLTATPSTGNGLTGEYFYRTSFTWLKVVRTDATINFNWGSNAPVSGVGADNFSVRWTGFIEPRFSESYTFYAGRDDVVRVWVNNVKVIDAGCCGEASGAIDLQAGVRYPIRVDFIEYAGGAYVNLKWASANQAKQVVPQSQLFSANPTPTATSAAGEGLTGEYFGRSDFSNLVHVRNDYTVDFYWNGAPLSGAPSNYFSVRWTGYVQPRFTERYTFSVSHDDVARLWIDNQQIINQGCCGEHSGSIELQAGVRYAIKLELVEYEGGATARLYWSSPTQHKQIIPQSQLFPSSSGYGIAPGSGDGLTTEYYSRNNFTWLSLVRIDAQVNFYWSGSPGSGVPSDDFSVRWTGFIEPRFSERYTFSVSHDDDVKLWVNDTLIVNAGCCGEHSGSINLRAGIRYPIRIELREYGGGATARLYWFSASQAKQVVPQTQLYSADPPLTPTATSSAGEGLTARYYAGTGFNTLKVTRTDAVINFSWGSGSPASGVPSDNFSARWTGYIQPRFSERYTFYAGRDDVVRVWVDNVKIIDSGCCGEASGAIDLQAGARYPIRVDFIEYGGGAYVNLKWSSATQYKQVVPQSQLFAAAAPSATPNASPTPIPLTPEPTTQPTPQPGDDPIIPDGQTWRFYYFDGARRIAMRVSGDALPERNGLFFLLTDHLGSVTGVVDSSGQVISEVLYRPWGGSRWSGGTVTSAFGYTNQRAENDLGLHYYRARWYDSGLGRFVQADTLTSNPYEPGSLDRYAYVANNPLLYVDPSGHYICPDLECSGPYTAPSGGSGSVGTSGGSSGGGTTDSGSGSSTTTRTVEELLSANFPWDSLSGEEQLMMLAAGFEGFEGRVYAPGYNANVNGTIYDPAVWIVGAFSVWKMAPAVAPYLRGLLPAGTGAAEAACADGDCTNEARTAGVTVYRLVENGATKYVGITNDFLRRSGEHLRSRGWTIQPIRGLADLTRDQSKAVEQVLINSFRLENLYNKINSIAVSNPVYEEALRIGQDLLQAAGFKP